MQDYSQNSSGTSSKVALSQIASKNDSKTDSKNDSKKAGKQVIKMVKYFFPDFMGLYNLGILECDDLQYCEHTIYGFELYIVEQWVSARKFSNVITSYTGNPSEALHGVLVRLPDDTNYWPDSLRQYHDKIVDYVSVKKTEGEITVFVTNLAYFPSTLNLLQVTSGSMKDAWPLLQVNFNLKRLGCGSRSGNLLGTPSITSLEKFSQIYKMTTTDPEEMLQNVIELVRVIQISLIYFRLLDGRFKDGIMCQHTVNAIHEWWVTYGKLYLGMDRPKNEGVLGPTTVAGIISFVLMCYFKFIVEDCISYKDPYMESSFYSGVYTFQKKHNLPKTSYLDMETMNTLFKVTSKVNTDIFKLKRVLKSTVQDIARKVNPIQLANEILTSDLDWLIENVQGGYLSLFWGRKRSHKVVLNNDSFFQHEFTNGDPFIDNQETISIKETEELANEAISGDSVRSWDISSSAKNTNEKQRCHNNEQFQKEFYRRASLPQLKAEKNVFQLDYNNGFSADEMKVQPGKFKRNYSFSDVYDILFTWDTPFQVSPVKIARDIIATECSMRLFCEGKESRGKSITAGPETLNASLDYCKKAFETIQNTKHELDDKTTAIKANIKEVNSLEAKFNYDLRILDTRMRDVDENLTNFGNRLDALEQSFKMKGKRFKALVETDILHSALELDKHAFEFFENEQEWNEGIFIKSIRQYVWPPVKREWERLIGWWQQANV